VFTAHLPYFEIPFPTVDAETGYPPEVPQLS